MSQRSTTAVAMILSALTLAACGGSSGTTTSQSSGSAGTSSATSSAAASATTSTTAAAASGPVVGFEGVPLEQGPELAPASTTQTAPVDGIKCAPIEQLIYHIHAHLAVFDNGRVYSLPAGVGIPGSQAESTPQSGPVAIGGHCYYWLHTHTSDGVIHIESPTKSIYSLGQFFDVWHQPLTDDRVASLSGKITAYVNGHLWKRSPRAIPLLAHEEIQFDIGDPIPPLMTVDWAKTGL